MDTMDLPTFGSKIVTLVLVNEMQLEDCLMEARETANSSTPELKFLISALERKGFLTPWQTGKIVKGDYDGLILGGYRVLYKIASGSFGRVYRADDPRTGRVVAIKVLRRRWSEDQLRIDLFRREGRVGLTLKHPNIVEVLAINQDPASGLYYIVMDFVEGDNLRKILQIRKRLTANEALRYLEDMASALAYAYSKGLTHRDLKLTNVLISSTGEAKLVDFGLAQMLTGDAGDEEKVDRTVDYAGLERATGVEAGDVRSDIFFLGCIFYEMLSGVPPMERTKDHHARMHRRRFEDIAPLNRSEIQAHPSVFMLLETMMALSPEMRYQTPKQLHEAIRSVRREIEGRSSKRNGATTPQSIFIAEGDERLQEVLREKFKEMGLRVYLARDPARALDRFRLQPYDALIVDVDTTGEDGLVIFEQVRAEAARKHFPCAAIAILSEEQADWGKRVVSLPGSKILIRPVTLKQLRTELQTLFRQVSPNEE